MIITNRSQRLLSISMPGHGLGVLLLVPLQPVDVPPELEQLVQGALEGPLRPYVAQGELEVTSTAAPTPSSAPPLEPETPPAAIASVDYANPELESVPTLEPDPEPPPAPRAKRR